MGELEFILKQLDDAKTPEEVFGPGPKEQARKVSLKLLHATHPDHFSTESDEVKQIAHNAASKINSLWDNAEKRFTSGIYGQSIPTPRDGPTVIRTKRQEYVIERTLCTGGTANIFLAMRNSSKGSIRVVLKIPNSPRDNDLIEHERDVLTDMRKILRGNTTIDEEWKGKLEGVFPHLLETIKVDGRVMNVFEREEGWYTLEEIRKQHPVLHPRAFTFIFNKILLAIDTANKLGFIHGAVVPNHMMIHVESHRGKIIDFTLAQPRKNIVKLPYWDKRWTKFMAPEVVTSRIPNTSAEVYSAAMCGVYMLGGLKSLEVLVEEPIREFLNKCLQPKRGARFRIAPLAFDEFQTVAQTVFGKPKFEKLEMNGDH